MFIFFSTENITHGILCILFTILACAVIVFVIRKCFNISQELSRKLLHFSVIATETSWLFAFSDWKLGVFTMGIFIVAVYPILLLFEKLPAISQILMERKQGELRKSLCAAGFMFIIVTALCWGWVGNRSFALASIFAWGPGDAAAALIGKKYGKIKIGKGKRSPWKERFPCLRFHGYASLPSSFGMARLNFGRPC